ncbi:MAG: hypothetical protein ABI076_01260 [Acidobacteriaceae bacterium]
MTNRGCGARGSVAVGTFGGEEGLAGGCGLDRDAGREVVGLGVVTDGVGVRWAPAIERKQRPKTPASDRPALCLDRLECISGTLLARRRNSVVRVQLVQRIDG